jgi:hypothetical protein
MRRYSIVRAIGRGSFGKALLCKAGADDLVVVKQIDLFQV